MKQGTYSDREIIDLMNKSIPKSEYKGLNFYSWKTIGKVIQNELIQRPLSKKDIKDIFDNIKANPPTPPEKKTNELSQEEKQAIADKKRLSDNQYTSTEKNGIEILYFAEAGMLNLIRDDHDEFEHIGDEHISDREDDGRVYINQEVKRLRDQKIFYFNYVGCPDPHDPYSLDNSLTEVKKNH